MSLCSATRKWSVEYNEGDPQGSAPIVFGALLRAAQVEVNSVDVSLHEPRRRDQGIRIPPRELDDQWPVPRVGSGGQELRPEQRSGVGGVRDEAAGVQHFGIAEVGAVLAAKQAKGQVAAPDHRCGDAAVAKRDLSGFFEGGIAGVGGGQNRVRVGHFREPFHRRFIIH